MDPDGDSVCNLCERCDESLHPPTCVPVLERDGQRCFANGWNESACYRGACVPRLYVTDYIVLSSAMTDQSETTSREILSEMMLIIGTPIPW